MARKLTDHQKIEIVEKYQTLKKTSKALAVEYNVHPSTINSLLKVRKIPLNRSVSDINRKYTLNEHYFDNVDTEEKAYFLGFLYADGCVSANGTITLILQEKDEEILNFYKNELNSTRPLLYKKKKKETHQNYKGLIISSRYLANRLAELGCTQRKTFTLKFPTEDQVPLHLIRHFIRGYFDGDGYTGYRYDIDRRYENSQPIFRPKADLVSTLDFCNGVSNVLNKELNITPSIYFPKEYRLTTRRLHITGQVQIFTFLKWLYQDCKVFLVRKYIKYQEIEEIMVGSKTNIKNDTEMQKEDILRLSLYFAVKNDVMLEKNRVSLSSISAIGTIKRYQVWSGRTKDGFNHIYSEIDAAVDKFMELSS